MISGSTRKDMCTARGLEAIDGLKLLLFTSYLFYPFASTLNNEVMTKGIYVCKAPTPRYQSTWDVSKVTSYLSLQGPLQDLSLKALTVMLCSLVCAQREQTLCLLDLNNEVMVQDAIKFNISEHKTARPGKTLEIVFPTFPGNVNLCPVSTLQEYLSAQNHFAM